jgi:hypothetical protein
MTGGESVDDYDQELEEETKENDIYSNRDKLNKIRLRQYLQMSSQH